MNFFAIRIFFLFLTSFLSLNIAALNISNDVLEKTKKAVVTIEARTAVSAYEQTGSWQGTGFIADKTQGLIVTNAHVSGVANVASYFITFHNGQQSEAKVVYYDLWQDFAVLQLNPADLPSSVEQITFTEDPVSVGDEVFIIGNNEARDFSFHSGYLSSLYDISGQMPQQSYVINLNTAGGSSGSPLVNINGDAIGLHYGGSRTFGLSLKGAYVSYALEAIKQQKDPVRKHIGAVTGLYSLDKAVRHRGVRKDIVESYLKDHPDSRNQVVMVQTIIAGSTAEGILKEGDILWQIDGKDIASSLHVLDDTMNRSKDDAVKLVVIRNGKQKEVIVKLYDINANKVEKLVSFGGAYLYKADDRISRMSGIPLGSVTITNVSTGGSFSAVPNKFQEGDKAYYRLKLLSINQNKTNTLEEVVSVIRDLGDEKFLEVGLKNYQPYMTSFGPVMISAHNYLIADIMLDNVGDKARVIELNKNTHEWSSHTIIDEK